MTNHTQPEGLKTAEEMYKEFIGPISHKLSGSVSNQQAVDFAKAYARQCMIAMRQEIAREATTTSDRHFQSGDYYTVVDRDSIMNVDIEKFLI